MSSTNVVLNEQQQIYCINNIDSLWTQISIQFNFKLYRTMKHLQSALWQPCLVPLNWITGGGEMDMDQL